MSFSFFLLINMMERLGVGGEGVKIEKGLNLGFVINFIRVLFIILEGYKTSLWFSLKWKLTPTLHSDINHSFSKTSFIPLPIFKQSLSNFLKIPKINLKKLRLNTIPWIKLMRYGNFSMKSRSGIGHLTAPWRLGAKDHSRCPICHPLRK